MKDRLSKTEIGKDALQGSVVAVASTVGEVTSIITKAVKDVATAIGGLATDVFEIRDGARKARTGLADEDTVDVADDTETHDTETHDTETHDTETDDTQ